MAEKYDEGAADPVGVDAASLRIAHAVRSALRRREADRRAGPGHPAPGPRTVERTPPLVVGLDGRSGAGKTRLARAVADLLRAELDAAIPPGPTRGRAVQVLALEDLYRGWDGLQEGLDLAAAMVARIARGQEACAPRWDWHAMATRGEVCVGDADAPLPVVLVVEGCGAGSDVLAPFVDLLVWVDAPAATRRARVRERDGRWEVPWERWAAQEAAVLARRDAATAADVVVGVTPRDAGAAGD